MSTGVKATGSATYVMKLNVREPSEKTLDCDAQLSSGEMLTLADVQASPEGNVPIAHAPRLQRLRTTELTRVHGSRQRD